MLGNLVQKLQTFSPLTSPTTSPTSSPKLRRRKFGFGKVSRKLKDSSWWKEEVREVQSEPELDYDFPKNSKHKISAPPATTLTKSTALQFSPRKYVNLQNEFNQPFGYSTFRDSSNEQFHSIYDVPAKVKQNVTLQLSSPTRFDTSKSLGRNGGTKEVERLSEYEEYFSSLLANNPCRGNYSQISRSHERLGQLLNRSENEYGEVERIQELFPNDNLRLFETTPVSQKMKGLIRKRSTTAARLHRAFSAKGLRSPSENNNNNGSCSAREGVYSSTNTGDASPSEELSSSRNSSESKPKRQFIMETPVQFTTGVQSQERHLFLFSDLLLVAKARNGGNFKLKEKVRVSEMWLANCLDDVVEVSKNSDASFVVGWPTTNVVASFSCVATRDLWYNKLSQVIADEREKEPPSTTIQITYYDSLSNTDICKTVSITSTTTSRECIALVLGHLELTETDDAKFQLWVRGPNDDSPYPLIGHEYPFAIKMNCLRELLQECDTEQCNNTLYNTDVMGRCQFILRQERKASHTGIIDNTLDSTTKKVSKKTKKSPIRIHRVFKRSNSKGDVTDGSPQSGGGGGFLFGQMLSKICSPEGTPPRPVVDLLHQLFVRGPFTVGIFRKSANARLVRELKEKLDNGEEIENIDGVHITSIAALFKDFLRSQPDCLLCSEFYEEWLEIPRITNTKERISRTLLLCSRLPRPHLRLLQLFLCVLHHIAKRSAENMMSASNLAVCVGPSLLWPSSPILALSPEASKDVPRTVEFLIERCTNIFGKDILNLMGDPPEQDPFKLDSGAEESDSLHSLHSGHSLHSSNGGMRRGDDSSIDSLEREFIGEGELSPLPRKDKMSLTNLSRDSGLTMSDSQLYTPDEEEEEESGSTSSSHSSRGDNLLSQQEGIGFQHYTAPNNPNAIYTAVYRRPEKMPKNSIHYDESDTYYASPSRRHTRVQITYSNSNDYQDFAGNPQDEYSRVYQERYNQFRSGDEGIYSIPNKVPSSQIVPFVMTSNFQRHNWMRRCSNARNKISKTNSAEGILMRSSSEESLLNKYNALQYGISLGAAGNSAQERVNFYSSNKERTIPSNSTEYLGTITNQIEDRDASILRRSKSAYQIVEGSERNHLAYADNSLTRSPKKTRGSWHMSRSTPHIQEEGDRSYDSSTLSDDDSTPHVSRSNSRGKEYGNGGGILRTWDTSHDSRNSSFKSERTGSMCTVVSAGSTSTLSSNPPSYEEALSRRSFVHKSQQQHLSSNLGQEYAIREEKLKSARAKQLYEDSLRIYREENSYPYDLVRASPAHTHDSDDSEYPPPIPPKSDPPPLPPKQKLSRKSQEVSNRLRHLPPVHIETSSGRKLRSVTSLPGNSSGCPLIHKTIIYTDDNPPTLPPKEKTVIEVEQNKVEKKSIETQTDDCDLLEEEDDDDDLRDESIQTARSWINSFMQPHVTSVKVVNCSIPPSATEANHHRTILRRGRTRRRNSSCRRSRSMPSRESMEKYFNSSSGEEGESDINNDDDEWPPTFGFCSTTPIEMAPAAPIYGKSNLKHLDPELQQEISWSVSQLRAIFGDTLKGAKVHPPPYRPPPSHQGEISSCQISNYGDTHNKRLQSNYGEESYV